MGINEEQSENGPLDIRNDFEMGIIDVVTGYLKPGVDPLRFPKKTIFI